MCIHCGCGGSHDHEHSHDHDHHHHHHGHERDPGEDDNHEHGLEGEHWTHEHSLGKARIVQIEQDILSKNAFYAKRNRDKLAAAEALAVNLISSPGSGKTTLLVKTIEALKGKVPMIVVEGDQQTSRDADRIRATGVTAQQINTGKGCHLDAHVVGHALDDAGIPKKGIAFIENVGNLVCPADFDIGEAHKVVILSVTEGEDKPLKYPNIFANASLMILSKIDLLPHVSFNVEECLQFARRINPKIEIVKVSSKTGEGISEWIAWLERAKTK